MEIGSKLRHSAKLSELLNCNCEVMGGGKRRKKGGGKNGKFFNSLPLMKLLLLLNFDELIRIN